MHGQCMDTCMGHVVRDNIWSALRSQKARKGILNLELSWCGLREEGSGPDDRELRIAPGDSGNAFRGKIMGTNFKPHSTRDKG